MMQERWTEEVIRQSIEGGEAEMSSFHDTTRKRMIDLCINGKFSGIT